MKKLRSIIEEIYDIKFDMKNKLNERRVHLDCGRKYFSKDWIKKLIDFMDFLELNTLTLHFSENKGFRIESEKHASIASNKFLSKIEVKEIIEYAKDKGVEIMPSLDTPGHVAKILEVYPEYGQESISGQKSKDALSITNTDALNFIKQLYKEYMDLFSTSKYFHIGGDEYMEFEKEYFEKNFKPVLESYARENLSSDYSWKDTFANYINEIASYVYENGFIPRVWNDGLYYGEHNEDIKQKIKMKEYIEIDFWCQMRWNPSVARLNDILKNGHKVYNLNSFFFYYVLRAEKPEDGRLQHSFDFTDQYKNIYENWTPGNFSDNTLEDDNKKINGSALCIWCDIPDLVEEEEVFLDIKKELIAFAMKNLDYTINQKINIEEIIKIQEKFYGKKD